MEKSIAIVNFVKREVGQHDHRRREAEHDQRQDSRPKTRERAEAETHGGFARDGGDELPCKLFSIRIRGITVATFLAGHLLPLFAVKLEGKRDDFDRHYRLASGIAAIGVVGH